ncbi:hypothetical protein [Thalassotalea aquiviva]|uniref:hypothetical protein n=1 Tax=Thalassotalea aquiviva TaxID=3242415 RepID=UPI00352A446E
MKKLIATSLVVIVILSALFLQTTMFNEANCTTANIHQGGDLSSAHKVLSLENDYMNRSNFEKELIFFGCKIKGTI